ncbi:MAG: response regulator [Gallionellaceae bacterium]|nr:response regulator [Gallionellaceae bacterium]
MNRQAGLDLFKTRILIVDDDAFTRKIVRRVLADLGFANVSEMDNAESAMTLLHGQIFDLIITDVQMPGINGLELVRRIRAGQAGVDADTRTMVLTSFANTEVLGVAIALDVNGFLVKPMKPGIVHDKIAQAMDEHPNVKPAISYHSINTDLRTLAIQPQVKPDPSLVNASLPRTAETERTTTPKRRVALSQLLPGMHLKQQVLTADGTLLLSEGHLLSRLNINRLIDLHSIITDEFLWIVDPDVEAMTP